MENSIEVLLPWKGAAALVWLVLFFTAERLRPAAREIPAPDATPAPAPAPGGWWRVGRNLGLWLANVGLSPLVVLPVSLWAVGQQLEWRPAWWSGWQGLVIDVVVLDFLIYWWHLANHRVPLLWRFHEVHHLDRFLDTTSAIRFHFGEVLLSALARAAVIFLLGFPFSSILAFETLVLMATLFHHSNLRLPAGLEGALSLLIITPSIHWVHHHARQQDTDSNYGTIFSFWDRGLGTFRDSSSRVSVPTGLPGAEASLRPAGALALPFRASLRGE